MRILDLQQPFLLQSLLSLSYRSQSSCAIPVALIMHRVRLAISTAFVLPLSYHKDDHQLCAYSFALIILFSAARFLLNEPFSFMNELAFSIMLQHDSYIR